MIDNEKNFIWNMIGSTAAAFTSLVFMIISTRINGENDAGVFSYAFATASILYILGTYILRSFQVTDISDEFTDSDYIFNRIFTCVLMIVFAVAFVLMKRYNFSKAMVIVLLCLLKSFEAFSEVLFGILQKRELLYQVGISMFLKAIIEMIIFLIVDYLTKDLLISSVAIVVVYFLITLFYDVSKIRRISLSKSCFSMSKNIKLLKTGFCTFVFTILNLYLVNASRYSLDTGFSDSVQTIYGIIVMPATFMTLLGTYLIQPFLTSISNSIKRKDYKKLSKGIFKICVTMLVLGIIVIGLAYFFEEPILSFIFAIDMGVYKKCMMIIILGAVFYGLATVMSNILIAFRKTKIQALMYLIISIITLFVSKWLVNRFEILGASLTYAFSMILISFLLFAVLITSILKYKNNWKYEESDVI